MNRKMIFYMIGRILQIEAGLFLLPAAVSLFYLEKSGFSFLIASAAAFLFGFLLTRLFRPSDSMIFAREGFVIVAFAWILMSAFGALPFVISREIPSFTDAFFETVSGFTTTGASILDNVEGLSRGILFWRSFTHWIGGMGVLVFIMAIFPSESGRSIHIMRAEMPGPIVGKILPKIRQTARILYLIYIAMTVLEMIFLLFGGMSLYESAVYAFGTAGTGGFGIRGDSVASYGSYIQWVITVFMLLFGVNFNLFYLILVGKVGQALKSGELRCYAAIAFLSVAAITANIYSLYGSFSHALRDSAFQVASILTTTGYSTCDFNLWPGFSKALLVLLMFVGGCAGSTAGGLKVSRLILIAKMIRRDLRKMIHPRAAGVVTFEGKRVEDATLNGVSVYFGVYAIAFSAILLLISLEPIGFESAFTAVAACINNIGPGLGTVGPAASFSFFSLPSKWLLSLAMLLGRLEIFPILLAFSPSTWRKR